MSIRRIDTGLYAVCIPELDDTDSFTGIYHFAGKDKED